MDDKAKMVEVEGNASPEVSDQFRIIQQFAVSLLKQNSLADLTWDIATNAGRILGFEDCVVYLREGDHLVQHAAYGIKNPSERTILAPLRIPMGDGIVGSVAKTQSGEIVSDTTKDSRYIPDQVVGRSEIAVPIIYEGKTIGVLDSESSQPDDYSPLDFELFQSVADIASSRIASAINEEKLRETQAHLIEYKQELESKVVERTQRISEALQTVREHEAELRKAQSELRRDRDWLRSILESISDGVIATDASGAIQMISASAATILESEQAVTGQNIKSILRIDPEGEDSLFDAEGNLVETTLKGILLTASNAAKQVKCAVKSIATKEPTDLAFVITLQDVTRQNFLEAEAAKAQRLESLGILAGGIAHDFNNQLAAVSGFVMAAKFADHDSQMNLLDLAEQSCLRSKKLTEQLLTLSKGGAPTIRPCDIMQVIKDAKLVASAGASTEVAIDDVAELPLVDADPGQMMQVFENIFINAQQATGPEGRIWVEAELTSSGETPFVQVHIRDNGPGIEARLLPKIFDPYFSTKDTGHGLGLTTSHSIVQRHNGQLVVDSTPGHGATFSITLPVSRSAATKDVEPAIEETQTLNILVLEDDELVQTSISALLEFLGHQGTIVAKGSEAVDAIQQLAKGSETFDLGLLDMTIVGGMGGAQTLNELRKLGCDFPIVSMSGYNAESLGRDTGFDGYLQKPFSVKQLKEAINEAVRPS